MALGGEVNHFSWQFFFKHRLYGCTVSNIPHDQTVARILLTIGQVGGIARIGKGIEIHHPDPWFFPQQQTDIVATNESASTCN